MHQSLTDNLKNNKLPTESDCKLFLDSVFNGQIEDEKLTEVLRLINKIGFGSEQLTGFAKSMRGVSKKVIFSGDLVDNCGTGGDGLNTFNISTTSSLIASCCDVYVAKHGNKSITSNSGSADILMAAGVNINLSPDNISECLKKFNFGFMFAPLHHESMKHVAKSRKAIAPEKTIFNLLGPLTNPANAKKQLIGVYSKKIMLPIAETLINLNVKKAMIVHSVDGLDEISLFDKTYVIEIDNLKIKEYMLDPRQYFDCESSLENIMVSNSDESLQTMLNIFNNKEGSAKNISILNAAALLYISGKDESIERCIQYCEKVISNFVVKDKLESIIKFTNSIT